jgi:AcrR family transcriptional regulator
VPVGKHEVTEALIDAAAELFAERGPGAVSVRDVAKHAGVNHGLVYRHFGSKDALIQAVLDRLVQHVRRAFADRLLEGANRTELFDALAENQTYWRVLARALLDGQTDWLKAGSFPLISAAVKSLRAARERGELDEDTDVEAAAASYVAVGLGWLVFEPFIAAATGMKGSPASRRKRMQGFWEAVSDSIAAG